MEYKRNAMNSKDSTMIAIFQDERLIDVVNNSDSLPVLSLQARSYLRNNKFKGKMVSLAAVTLVVQRGNTAIYSTGAFGWMIRRKNREI